MSSLVSQEALRRKLASVFSQYTLYLQDPDAGRPNCLIYGRSGTGKTMAVDLCAKMIDVPVTTVSAASISPPSYRGRTRLDALIQHWRDYKTDYGIIFIDEVDKWTSLAIGRGDQEREAGGRACQFEMLKYLERDQVAFVDEAKDYEDLKDVIFDTQRTLWIMAGAFTRLEAIVRKRLHNVYLPEDDVFEHAIPKDFKAYGIVEEFADRISTWAWTTPLKVADMIRILSEQDTPKWRRRFQAIDCELDLQPGALGSCAQHAFEQKEGPRVAKAMLNRAMDDIFEIVASRGMKRVAVGAVEIQSARIEIADQAS